MHTSDQPAAAAASHDAPAAPPRDGGNVCDVTDTTRAANVTTSPHAPRPQRPPTSPPPPPHASASGSVSSARSSTALLVDVPTTTQQPPPPPTQRGHTSSLRLADVFASTHASDGVDNAAAAATTSQTTSPLPSSPPMRRLSTSTLPSSLAARARGVAGGVSNNNNNTTRDGDGVAVVTVSTGDNPLSASRTYSNTSQLQQRRQQQPQQPSSHADAHDAHRVQQHRDDDNKDNGGGHTDKSTRRSASAVLATRVADDGAHATRSSAPSSVSAADDTSIAGTGTANKSSAPPPHSRSRRYTLSMPTVKATARAGKLDASGGVCESIRLSYTYTLADVARRSRNMATGMLAVFLLVFFTGVAVLGATKVSYVLLRLSELTAGEVDVEMRPGTSDASFSDGGDGSSGSSGSSGSGGGTDMLSFTGTPLNFTALSPLLDGSGVVVGASPRWMMRGTAAQVDTIVGGTLVNTSSTTGVPVVPLSSPVNVLIIDTARERALGIGRSWPYRAVGYGEVQLFDPIVRYLGMQPNRGERLALYPDKWTLQLMLTYLGVNMTLRRPRAPRTLHDVLLMLFFRANNITDDSLDLINKTRQRVIMALADGVTQSFAKYPSALANVAVVDYRTFVDLFYEQSGMSGSLALQDTDDFHMLSIADVLDLDRDAVMRANLSAHTMSIAVVLRDRYDIYYEQTAKSRDQRMTRATNQMMLAVGVELSSAVSFPVAEMMTTFDGFKATLLSIFIVVVVGTVVLCTILVFTLLIINADERQFELAMLRAQGMPHTRIAVLLLVQTAAFAVPGTVVGVLLVWAANAVLERVLASLTHAPPKLLALPPAAAIASAALGVVMPFIAAYGPVRRALGGSLRDALDIYRQAQNETHVVMTRLEDMGIKAWQLALGVFLAVLGFILYYVLPLSLLFRDMLMFFALLDLVLLCFVVSMCLVVHVLEPYAESLLVWLMLWGPERRLRTLILRNLHSHRSRNSKAFLTFMLTIACLTASGIMFLQLGDVTTRLTELQAGAPVTVTALTFDSPINATLFDDYFAHAGAAYVSTWAYRSFALSEYPQVRSATTLSNYFGFSAAQQVISVSEHFYEATYTHLNLVARYKDGYDYPVNAAGKRDVVKSMYEQAPYVDVPTATDIPIAVTGRSSDNTPNLSKKVHYRVPAMIAQAAELKIGVDVDSGAELQYTYATNSSGDVATALALEVRAEMTSLAGFPTTAGATLRFGSSSAVIVPETYFVTLLNPIALDFDVHEHGGGEGDGDDGSGRRGGGGRRRWRWRRPTPKLPDGAVTTIQRKTMYVQLRPDTTRLQREALVNALQARVNESLYLVVDSESVKEQLATIKTTILVFFYIIAVICIIVCGLMMWLTFIANVQLNSWSVGVLRALGFHMAQLIRASIYEALSIVLSGFVLGIAVGLVAGMVLSLQMASYQSLPLAFDVPYVIILVVLGLALLAAVCGSVLPYLAIARRPIALVLRHM